MIKLIKYIGNIETTTKFSKWRVFLRIIIYKQLQGVFYKKAVLKNLATLQEKNCLGFSFKQGCRATRLQVDWKQAPAQVFSGAYCEHLFWKTSANSYFWLFFYCSIYLFSAFCIQSKQKQWSFMVKKMFIEIKLCNPMTYVFKGHFKIVKINMVKFNVSILIRLKIMGSF